MKQHQRDGLKAIGIILGLVIVVLALITLFIAANAYIIRAISC